MMSRDRLPIIVLGIERRQGKRCNNYKGADFKKIIHESGEYSKKRRVYIVTNARR